jgi:hypothetical protein
MTEPGDLSPERVAELERQLSDAAAQVAKVQAELAQAKAGEANGVPYGEPPPVSAPAAPVGHGVQAVDLTSILGPEMAQQVREQFDQLGQFGLGHQFADMFGALTGEPAAPTAVERLADPPRRVPLSYRLASLWSLSWWELFGIVLVGVTPIALFVFFPWLVPGVFIAGVLAIAVVRGRRYVRRAGLLKWGKVATVTNADEISRGTYYSGTTYNNMRVRQATGWVGTTRWYSGPASKTEINFRVDDADGTLTLRGLPYANGVILADPRKPKRALCVSSFPFSVQPDANGEIVDRGLSPWSWIGIGFTIIVHVALLAGAWYAVDELWVNLPG